MHDTSYNSRGYYLVFCLIEPLKMSSDTWCVVSCKFFLQFGGKKQRVIKSRGVKCLVKNKNK